MAQAQRPRLANRNAHHVVGLDRAHSLEQRLFARVFELALELIGHVKVVVNGAFVAARHKNHLANAGGIGFFYCVLNEWLVHHGQHFFGHGLGGR